jgi:hypothetical protein
MEADGVVVAFGLRLFIDLDQLPVKGFFQPRVATLNSSTCGRVKFLHPQRGGTVEL